MTSDKFVSLSSRLWYRHRSLSHSIASHSELIWGEALYSNFFRCCAVSVLHHAANSWKAINSVFYFVHRAWRNFVASKSGSSISPTLADKAVKCPNSKSGALAQRIASKSLPSFEELIRFMLITLNWNLVRENISCLLNISLPAPRDTHWRKPLIYSLPSSGRINNVKTLLPTSHCLFVPSCKKQVGKNVEERFFT